MLVAVVLLAILTIGAVSASDTGDNLTAIDEGGDGLNVAETPLDDGDTILSDGNENAISLDGISNGTEFDDNGTIIDDEFEFDDENDDVQIYVKKDTYFSQDSDDRLISVLVPNDQTGGVQVVGQRDDEYHRFFYKEFSQFDESKVYPYGDYNKVYWISPLDLGGFDGIQGPDVYVQAFDNSQNIVTNLYYISWLNGSFKLNPSNSDDEGDDEEGPNFEFSEDEIIIDVDNEDYDGDARVVSGYFSEPTSGILILSNENVILLNKTISDDDEGWEHKNGDSIYRIYLKDISSFEGVNDGDVFELAFYMDGEDEPVHTSSIAIEVGEGYVKFFEWFDPNQFRVADAHDDMSLLETWDVIALYCPDGHVGMVNVTVRDENGEEHSFLKDIWDMDENNLLHWNLTDLGMVNVGFYNIELNVNDGEFKEEWTTEVYIPIRYEEQIYLYPCDIVAVEVPTEYDDGIIIIEVDGSQLFNRTLSEFLSDYDDFYWTYDKVGNGEDDINTDIKVYHIQNSIIPDIELRTYDVNTILIVNGRTMDKSAEIEITEGDIDNDISVNIWNNEGEDLYVDSEFDVVSVDVPGNVEGTITVIVNGDNKFVWLIDEDYHGWTLMDLEIVEAGDYNIVVKHDDEIICNETISVVEFNNNKVRVVVVSDKLRIFCPENVTGTVTISIDGQDVEGLFYPIGSSSTHGLTQNRWTEWSADDLNLELDTYYRITLIVSNDADEILYNATEWYEFERFEENCQIWYDGSEDIVARGNWASVNRFKFYHEMGVDGIVSFYLENDWDSEPAYTLDLSDKPTGYYYVSLANLGIFEPGKYEIGINYEHDDGDVEGYDCVVTVYEPQSVTGLTIHDELGNYFYLTIDIAPIRTMITGNTYNDYVILMNGTVESYMGAGSYITVNIDGKRSVRYNTKDLISIPNVGWVIGSNELGIDKAGSYDIAVEYYGPHYGYWFSCPGTINYISNVSMDVSMYNFHSDILYYGYGMDSDYYITIRPRDNHFPLDNLEGTVTVYIDGNPKVFDIRSLEIVGDDENGNYFISASQLNITEGNHSIKVIYEGNCPGVEITQNFTAFKLTSEKFFEYSDIEINENISNESDSAISIDFWGNPMSAEPMIWGKLVLYVNGEKINRTQVVIYEESERWINWTTYDINDPQAIELINKIHQNQLPGWEYDIYDWLCLVHIYWHFNETLDISLEDLNITSPGEYNITFKYIGESGEGPQLEILRGTIHYNLKNNLTLTVSADDIDYGSPANIVITTDETFSGDVLVSIAGADYTVNIVNGKGSLNISDLDAGSYDVNAIFAGNELFNYAVATSAFDVDKANSTLSVANVDFNYGGSGSTNAVFTGATGITAVVVDHPEAVININGNKIKLSGLKTGTYTLRVETIPDANHNPVVKTATVKVNKVNTVLTATKVTTTYGTSKKLYVTLKDANGNNLRGKEVYIKVNGGLIFAKTMSNGRAVFTLPKEMPVKTNKISVSFTQDDNNYKSSRGYAYVVVKKATPKLTAPKKTYYVSQKNKKYTVVLKSDKNVPIKNGKVNLRVNGVTYSLKTDAKGKVTFGPDIYKKGTFKVNVKFVGNGYFNAKSVNTYIIVK